MAPCGAWINRIFSFQMWSENDPGGWYLASAHQLFDAQPRPDLRRSEWGQSLDPSLHQPGIKKGPLYPGHPGITLQLALKGLQGLYLLAASGGGDAANRSSFLAAHLPTLILYSKVFEILLHLVSFVLLYRFAKDLLGSEEASLLAVLGYATSFPVLYYASRISPEPLAIIFGLGTFLSVWRCQDSIRCDRPAPALTWAAAAGFLATSGVVTKAQYLAALPVVALVVLACPPGPPRRGLQEVRCRVSSSIVFSLSALASLALYSTLINWSDFLATWNLLPAGPAVSPVLSSIAGMASNIVGMGQLAWSTVFRRLDWSIWLPAGTKRGIFGLCEDAYVAVSLVGMALHARRDLGAFRRFIGPLALAISTLPMWLYRVALVGDMHGFHYLFVITAVLSVHFGYLSLVILKRTARNQSAIVTWMIAMSWILLVHQIGLWAVLDSRINDIRVFRAENAQYVEALRHLGAGERLAVIADDGWTAERLHGLSASYSRYGPSALIEDFPVLVIPSKQLDAADASLTMRRMRVSAVVDRTNPALASMTLALEEWLQRRGTGS